MPKNKSGADEVAKTSPHAKKSTNSPKSSKSASPATPKKNSDLITYKIRLLDSDQKPLDIAISKNDDGQVLFNKVCDELGGIIERDYFGLRYMDKNNQRQWLDLGRNVKKQMTGAHSSALSFRVKHYPGNPITDFHQEISQYLLYLQIRRDLVQGRLLCPLNELYTIGALILQSEYGDAPDEEESTELNGSAVSEEDYKTYFKNFKIVFNQTKKIETEIIARHRTYRGLTARDAEVEVIKRASKLPTYGVDPFPVKIISKEKSSNKSDTASQKPAATGDAASSTIGSNQQDALSAKSAPGNSSGSVYLGLRHTGLTTYVGLQPSENFEWDSIDRLACDGKDFIVYVKPTADAGGEERAQSVPLPESPPTPQGSEETEAQKSAASAETEKSKKGKATKKNEKPKKEKKLEAKSTKKANKKPAKPRVVTFRCDTKAAALALWKWTVDRQSFFTLQKASEAKLTKTTHSLFRRSHSYRFIGKSQMELKSITNSSESLPQPSFVRVSSLRRPKSQEIEFDPASGRATLPARIRSAENGSFPASEPPKRPAISTNGDQPATTASSGVMNIANDLRAAPGSEADTPIKGSSGVDQVSVVPVSVNPATSAAPSTNNAPLSTDVDDVSCQVRQRVNHTTKNAPRDSECLRAVKEIDSAIDSIHNANGHKQKSAGAHAVPNGEVSREIKSSVSTTNAAPGSTRTTGTRSNSFCSRGAWIFALEAAAVIGVVCIGVVIAALETSPTSGSGTGLWTGLAVNLQGQPVVASFNEYVYAPIRGFFLGGGR